jgi:ABC-type transport system involved in multi-copper enzyme maturation permease subunit
MNKSTAIKSNTQNAGHLLSIFCWVLIFIIVTIFASILAVDLMSDEIEKPGSDFWPIMMAFVGYVVLILLATRGLRLHQQWARYVAGVLAVIALIAFPVGTVLGLFVLSYLIKGWHEQ